MGFLNDICPSRIHRSANMTENRLLPSPKTAILVLVLLFSFVSSGYGQDPPAWQFKFGGKVTEFNDKKQKDIALEGSVVTLFKGAQQVQSQSTNNSGKFKFSLDPNNDYTLTVTKPGYITKRFSISTYNVPTERGEGAFAEFDVEIGLFKLFPGLDYSCLDKPIAKISYNPARDVDDFDYDKVYTASIQACVDNLKRLEAEARAKQKLYDAAIEKADKAFNASQWQAAKDAYNEALTYLPNEQYPKDQIIKCEEKIGANSANEKKYSDAIAEANRLFDAKDWSGAKAKYQEASGIKPAEQFPKDRIVLCDQNIANAGKQKVYDDAIAAADSKFKSSDWAGAKIKYQEASGMKPAEQYPKDQIVKCDAEIAMAGLQKQYDDVIAAADTKFKAADFAGAKVDYQKASGLKPAEQYPKDQISKCDAEIAKKGLQKQYEDAIAAADAKFKAEDFPGAKVDYQKATGLKSAEQYPKDQITKCDAEIAKAGLDKQYSDLIAAADAKFTTSDWAGAKAEYQKASALKATEQYPKGQIKLCDDNIAKSGLDKQYNDAIAAADAKFKTSDWAGAKVEYQKASALKVTEQYPKDQIKLCDDNIAKSGLDKQYNDAIALADAKFKAADWAGAKAEYQKASVLKSAELYPKDQIVKCDVEIAKQGLEKQYADAIASADKKFKASDWAGAKADYQKATSLKTAEQYPKDQIAKCDENIDKAGTDKSYNTVIAAADAKFKLKDWAGAKAKYEEALTIKAGEQYPTDQIKLCNDSIVGAADKKYNEAIAAADAKFDAAEYTAAKAKYQEASAMKPSEQYPKDRIKLCDENIAKNGLDKTYNAAIAAADAKFKSSDWAGAKAKYQEASSLKSVEQYPKDQIALCDKNIASAEGLEANYAKAIARGDSAFKVEDYETAKSAYESALALKSGQAYPKAQLDEINKRLAAINAGNEKDAKYRATLATADSLFALKDYAAAQVKYQDASTQRPLEAYPKDKYGECQRLLGDQKADAARQKRYDDLIKKADAKFASSDWSGAKKLYQDALKEKPLEVYPKTRIAECDKKLNPVTKSDTARTAEQIKEDYRNEIAKSYPQGLTTMEEKEGGNVTLKRIVVIGDKGYVYTKKSYSWGTFYFKDGVQISEGTFNYETSAGYIQQELSKVSK